MEYSDFVYEIKKLEYNLSKDLKKGQREFLYEQMKNISLFYFKQIVKWIIKNRTPGEFRFSVKEFKYIQSEIYQTQQQKVKEYQCCKCKDTGKIFKGNEYAGRCDCVVESEDIRALLVLMKYPDLLKPIEGKPYDEWREYITRPEIVQVLMAG